MRFGFSLLPDIAWAVGSYLVLTLGLISWLRSRDSASRAAHTVDLGQVVWRMAIVFAVGFGGCWMLDISTLLFAGSFVAFSLFCGLVGGPLHVAQAGLFGVPYIIFQYVAGFPDHDKWILSPQPPRPRPPRQATELDQFVGRTGVTVSALRPGGEVMIDGQRYPAASNGSQFIDGQVSVEIIAVRNGKFIVGPLECLERSTGDA